MKLTAHKTLVASPEPRREYTPDEYGQQLDDSVNDMEGLLTDLTFDTNSLGPEEAWRIINDKMYEAFPGLNYEDLKWAKSRWKVIRSKTASRM